MSKSYRLQQRLDFKSQDITVPEALKQQYWSLEGWAELLELLGRALTEFPKGFESYFEYY